MMKESNMKISVKEIAKAQISTAKFTSKTPLIYSNFFSNQLSRKIFFKCESFQRTGSFKIRGAINRFLQLSAEERKAGVVTASYGNLAQAVASAAKSTEVKSTIVMPVASNMLKIEYAKSHGADVILFGNTIKESLDKALAIAKEQKTTFLHPFEDIHMITGAGTIGLEILEQNPDTEAILVPVGGGALVAGIATAIKEKTSKIAIIGIQTQNCSAFYKAYHSKNLNSSTSEISNPIADSINISHVSKPNYDLIEPLVDDFLVVSDEKLVSTMVSLLEQGHLVVEGAGAVTLSALLEDQLPTKYRNATLILSGGNVDSYLLSKVINHGLCKKQRIFRLDVVVEDHPGALKQITEVLNKKNINIIQIFHNRVISESEFNQTRIQLVLESRGDDHRKEIIEAVKASGVHEVLSKP